MPRSRPRDLPSFGRRSWLFIKAAFRVVFAYPGMTRGLGIAAQLRLIRASAELLALEAYVQSASKLSSSAPGWRFLHLARRVFPRCVADGVFAQIVRDENEEYLEALAAGRKRHAAWIRVRCQLILLSTLVLHFGVSAGKRVAALWKLSGGG